MLCCTMATLVVLLAWTGTISVHGASSGLLGGTATTRARTTRASLRRRPRTRFTFTPFLLDSVGRVRRQGGCDHNCNSGCDSETCQSGECNKYCEHPFVPVDSQWCAGYENCDGGCTGSCDDLPSYCTTDAGKCSAGPCTCQSSSHVKSAHNSGSGTCHSCGPPLPTYCTTGDGGCTAAACECEASSHLKYTHKVSGQTCYSCAPPLPDGASCTVSMPTECSSSVCTGGRCCGTKGRAAGCTRCSSDGSCEVCGSDYIRSSFQCVKKKADGSTCSLGSRECVNGVCRAGICCGPKGQSQGCDSCNADGNCASCSPSGAAKYTLKNGECTATTTTTVVATVTTVTTTTTLKPNGGRCGSAGECLSKNCKDGWCIETKDGGAVCTSGYDCASSTCRNGVCCSAKGATTSCVMCGPFGGCSKCHAGYKLSELNECVTPVNPVDTVTPKPTSGTTPMLCNANCTKHMYNNTQCNLECNTYHCRCEAIKQQPHLPACRFGSSRALQLVTN